MKETKRDLKATDNAELWASVIYMTLHRKLSCALGLKPSSFVTTTYDVHA